MCDAVITVSHGENCGVIGLKKIVRVFAKSLKFSPKRVATLYLAIVLLSLTLIMMPTTFTADLSRWCPTFSYPMASVINCCD